ncbi:MAG: hypothetical protein ACREUL_08935 [Steroidobacteraceae bacterium]
MGAADGSLILRRARPRMITALMRVAASPRLYVYLSCTALAVLVSYHLGKDMLWDTMDYHVYAGFSALHDRFDLDYFAAGPAGYFNPYAYVPFYLLVRSSLTPLEDASILAALQSAILWLTYELAITAAPSDKARVRMAIGILATALAFANPVLIYEMGSSYADITTAELALAGWLVTLRAVQDADVRKVACGGLLLGAASALKATNSVHALAAVTLLAFIPGSWKDRLRHAAVFAAGLAGSFVAVNAPWSIRLEQQFGNPLFPLLNGVFRSPEYSSGPMVAYRFIPQSLADALLRPFSMVLPRQMVDVEWIAPDLRYAVLAVLALMLLLYWILRRIRPSAITPLVRAPDTSGTNRVLLALGCGFVVDWTLWLTASGNGRYLIPMASVAAVLNVVLIFRLFAGRCAVRNGLLLAVVGIQILQACMGTEYRPRLPWHDGPWINLSIPARISSQANLYFLMGEQTHSFIIPYLARHSGFINLDGEYGLGPDGANGIRIRGLIERFNPHLRVLMADPDGDTGQEFSLADTSSAANTLRMFGLKADTRHCARIVASDVATFRFSVVGAGHAPRQAAPSAPNTDYLVTCRLVWNGSESAPPVPGQHVADLAFDHLEEACPGLFQPPHPLDRLTGDAADGYVFSRRYANTEILAWIAKGQVRFQNFTGGPERSAEPEREWERAPLAVACGRAGGGFLKLLPPMPASH